MKKHVEEGVMIGKSILSPQQDTREKVLELRSFAKSLTLKSLTSLEKFATDHDWRVRLELSKTLKKFIDNGKDKVRSKAMEQIDLLREDIHPVVRLCVHEIKRNIGN